MEFHTYDQVSRLHRLVTDLERLEAGLIRPPDLTAEPFLDNWSDSARKVPCLQGIVEGHPSLPDGHMIVTSEVFGYFQGDDEHFVRTRNHWHRLGGRRG